MEWLSVIGGYFALVGFGPLIAIALRERRETRKFVAFMRSAWGE